MDRVAVVTGASRGTGRANAIRLARDFGAVSLVVRTPEALAETADAVRTAGAEPPVGMIDALACITGKALCVDNGETKVL